MNILVVDDHPMTVDGYISALKVSSFEKNRAVYSLAYSCEDVFNLVNKCLTAKQTFDYAVVDYGLPSYKDKELNSGGDLIHYMRKKMPKCRFLMITAHSELLTVFDIAKEVRPEGLVNKSDITPTNLPVILNKIIAGEEFKSEKVKETFIEIFKKDLMFNDHNRQILMYLQKGFKPKDLVQIVNLSFSNIQKRIVEMKKAFEIVDDENSNLIYEAQKLGFI